mmetsp:Transcript_654/g.995  ORF Transcript_654/g.995 Transcript_654/m.995 type:complete len:80 (-) Transcript_654:195-434(-)
MTTKMPHPAGLALADDMSSSSAKICHGIVAKVPSFTRGRKECQDDCCGTRPNAGVENKGLPSKYSSGASRRIAHLRNVQ